MKKLVLWLRARRKRAVKFFLLLLSLFIIPALIIGAGLNVVAENFVENSNSEIRQNLEKSLDELDFFAKNDRFAHFLLRSTYSGKNGRILGLASLPAKINLLKKQFPGAFTFIVADKNFRIIPELSDKKGYSYLFRETFTLIRNCYASLRKGKSIGHNISFVDRVKRLKRFLGHLIKKEDLLNPLLDKFSGRSILVSGDRKKYHLWYGIGKDFYILIFIARSFIWQPTGLLWAQNRLNQKYRDIYVGFCSYPPEKIPGIVDPVIEGKIKTALARNERLINEESSGSNDLIACRFLNQDLRGFSLLKTKVMCKKSDFFARLFAFLWPLILPLIIIVYVRNKISPINFTIKLKISFYFIYSVVLPISIIVFFSNQFKKQLSSEMSDKLKNECYAEATRIELSSKIFLKRAAEKADEKISRFIEKHGLPTVGNSATLGLRKELNEELNYDAIFYINNNLKEEFSENNSPDLDITIIKQKCVEAFEKIAQEKYLDKDANYRKFSWRLFEQIVAKNRQISFLGVYNFQSGIFFRVLNSPKKLSGNLSLIVIIWTLDRWKEEFIREYFKSDIQAKKGIKTAVFCLDRRQTVFSPEKDNFEIDHFFRLVANDRVKEIERIRINGQNYLGVGISSKEIKNLIFAVFAPHKSIEERISRFLKKSSLFFYILLFMLSLSIMFLRKYFFFPLQEILRGITAIKNRSFNEKLQYEGKNEFGEVIGLFNKSLESLQQLEIAVIVQDSLCKSGVSRFFDFEVVAKTLSKGKLGGDFFDYHSLSDSEVAIMIGDVTGHGISAALNMAMAKAVILHEIALKTPIFEWMSKLDKLFLKLRSQGARYFMTFMCLEANTLSGKIAIYSAGHPFPFIKKNSGEVQELKIFPAPPLGFKRKTAFAPVEIYLNKGEALFLYTDGFYETKSTQGDILGFSGLRRTFESLEANETILMVDEIFGKLEEYSVSLEDDCTMIILRRL